MASRRFEGAVTTPDDGTPLTDQTLVPPPRRPDRPILIELAAAILIVGGLTSLLGAIGVPGPLGTIFIALDVTMVLVGMLIRGGRGWIVAINVVSVALFVELTALPSPLAIVFGSLDAIVLAALFRHRAWFAWTPETTADALAGDAAAHGPTAR